MLALSLAALLLSEPFPPAPLPVPSPPPAPDVRLFEHWHSDGAGFELHLRSFELDSVDFSLDRGLFEGGGNDDGAEVRHHALGLRLREGGDELNRYVGIGIERIDIRGGRYTVGSSTVRLDDDVDALSFEFGGAGVHRFDPGPSFTPILDYELGLSLHYGHGDGVIDRLWFLEPLGRFGAGIEVENFQAAVGLVGTVVVGGFDVDPGRGDLLEGSNLGAYVRAGYRGPQIPVTLSFTGMVGDVRGAMFEFGLRF